MLIAPGHNLVMPIKALSIVFVGAAAFVAGISSALFWDAGEDARVPEPSANTAIVEIKPEHLAVAPGKPVEFKRAKDGLFYVTGDVNGARVRFIVDTGASVVVLTREDAELAGINGDAGSGKARIQTAGGSAAIRWAKLDHLTIAGQRVEKLDAAIVRDGLKVSLLGQNYLSELNSVMLRGDRLRFN